MARNLRVCVMSVDILFPVLLVAVAAWFTLYRGAWRTLGTASGNPAPTPDTSSASASTAPAALRTAARLTATDRPPAARATPTVKLVPTEGFIPDDRTVLIAEAESRLEGHIAYERVQLRPGWLLFDPKDILGQPPVVIRFASDRADQPEREVWLYAIDDIRRLEREHSYLAQCRRASVLARWGERRAAIRRRDISAAAN